MEEQDLKFSEFIERYLKVCSVSEKYRIENILKDMGYFLSNGKIVKTSNNKKHETEKILDIEHKIENNFINKIGEDSDEKMISLNKACEWLKKNLPPAMVRSDCYMFNGEFIEDFKKAMNYDAGK